MVAALGVLISYTAAFGQGATNSWVRFAVDNQRNAIAQDEPLNWVMRLGAHNAYSSFAYGHDTDPNQSLTVTSMLERGARIIALDLHVLDDDLYVCHNDLCAWDKTKFDDVIEEIGDFIAIRQDFVWVQIEYLPYGSCVVQAENQCQDASLPFTLQEIADRIEDSVKEHLDRGAGLVWKPNEALFVGLDGYGRDAYAYPASRSKTFCDGGEVDGRKCSSDGDCIWVDGSGAHIEDCEPVVPVGAAHRHRYPTLRELQRAGKRVMVSATGMTGCCGNDCGLYSNGGGQCSEHSLNAGASCSDDDDCEGMSNAVSWIWDDGGLGGNIGGILHGDDGGNNWVSTWSDFDTDDCEIKGENRNFWSPSANTGGGYPIISTVSEDRSVFPLSQNAGIIENEDMVDLTKCNVGRINLDFFDRAMDMDPLVCCWYDDDCIPGISIEVECPADDQRVARTIWSWAQAYTPGTDDNYVFMRGIDGRWGAVGVPQNQFHCACGVPRTGDPVDWLDKKGNTWEVTEATGSWDECPELCEAEFGAMSIPLAFSVPVNGYQNPKLYKKLKQLPEFEDCSESNPENCPNVWLRFRRETGNGAGALGGWSKVVLPKFESVDMLPTPGDPLSVDFTIRIHNPDELDTQLLMLFDDGVSPIFDSPVNSNGTTIYEYSRAFLASGTQVLDMQLFSENDTGLPNAAIYLQDTYHLEFEYAPNFLPELDQVFNTLTREDLIAQPQGCSESSCVGHQLQFTVQFHDGDDDFTAPPDCSTIRLCKRGVRVLYGDGDDNLCVDGTCSIGGTSCSVDTDCGVRPVVRSLDLGGGPIPNYYEFDMTNLYQDPGVYEGKIIIDDGKVEVIHPFTVFNTEDSTEPEILTFASGCTKVEMFTGEMIECQVSFVDENHETDTYAMDIDWGDGSAIVRSTDVILGVNGFENRHLARASHVYNTPSAPNEFPIRVMMTDDVGLPPGPDGVCAADNVSPCTDDLDCGGACRIPGSPNGSGAFCNDDSECSKVCSTDPQQPCVTNGECPSGGTCEAQECRAADTCRISNVQEVRYCVEANNIRCDEDTDCPSGPCGGLFAVEVFQGNTPTIVCPASEPSCGAQSDTGDDATIGVGGVFARTFQLSDPDVADVHTLYVRYGQGLPVESPPIANNQFVLQHTYNEPGLYEIVFSVVSEFEGPLTQNSTGPQSILVWVLGANQPPALDPIQMTSIYITETFNQSVTFTDAPQPNPWVGYVDYGDGTLAETVVVCSDGPPLCDFPPFGFDMQHTYTEPGVYNGSIFFTDQIDVTVTPFVVEVLSLDDPYEPNENCNQAVPILPGTIKGVLAIEPDVDWFSIFVESGQTIAVTAETVFPNDFTSFDILDGCTENDYLTGNHTLNDPIQAIYHNTGPSRTLYVRARADGPDVRPGEFDITVSLSTPGGCSGGGADTDGDGLPNSCDPCAGGVRSADADGDGDVDAADYSHLSGCFTGPAGGFTNGCECLDFDGDGDNDLTDFAEFQSRM
ncbi:MAG: hypothetical protein KDA54_12075 [Phycisphaerales bacterium]|nr:hypothetical protein [Phycisphaerales bacterium]